VSVAGDFLRLGLDNSARVVRQLEQRTQELQKTDPGFSLRGIYGLGKPVKSRKVAQARTVAEKLGLTSEMGRAWIGGYMALRAFYEVAHGVPALREIAELVVEKPSVGGLAKVLTGSKFQTTTGNAQPFDPAAAGLLPVKSECFQLGFAMSLEKKPLVTGVLVATAPVPPLDTCAGILGLLAVHPGDHRRMLQVQTIATHTSAVATP
jgi:hypothetical protein